MLYYSLYIIIFLVYSFPSVSDSEESTYKAGELHWGRKIPWRREWKPTPVFLPGESHGQKNLVGCSPWSCKESDTTE